MAPTLTAMPYAPRPRTLPIVALAALLTSACGGDTAIGSADVASSAVAAGAEYPATNNPNLAVAVQFPAARSAEPLDGRLLLLVSTDSTREPRFQVSDGGDTQLVFGTDVDGWMPDTPVRVDAGADGYPLQSLAQLPPGRYWVQAFLNRYETFTRSDGHTIKLPTD